MPESNSNKPPNTAFRQQRLQGWDCELTLTNFTVLLIAIAVAFGAIGAPFIVAARQTTVLTVDYSNCTALPASTGDPDVSPDPDLIRSHFPSGGLASVKWAHQQDNYTYDSGVTLSAEVCTMDITLPEAISGPVRLFYVLKGFAQNHRSYSTSLDAQQLLGEKSAASTCNPLAYDGDKPIYPCGMIANSLFNDSLADVTMLNARGATNANGTLKLPLLTTGLAWSSDKDLFKKTKYTNAEVVPPPAWRRQYPKNYTTENPIPDVTTDERLQVWMRTAGLSSAFAKAWARIDDAMELGTYRVRIVDEFPVDSWRGKKLLKIKGPDSWGTDGNEFIGWLCIGLAGFCIFVVLIVHIYDRFFGGRERRLDFRPSWEREGEAE